MEDYHVADLAHVKGNELGLFAIFDGHLGDTVPAYLQKNLFSNIMKESFGHIQIERSQKLMKKQTKLFCRILRIWDKVAPLL